MSNTDPPLHIAARNGNVEIVNMLLDAGHDPEARNSDGQTPLHFAIQAGHVEVVSLLAEKIRKNQTSAPPPTPPSTHVKTQRNKPVETPANKAIGIACVIFLIGLGIFIVYTICVSIHTGEAADTASRTLGNSEWWGRTIARILFVVVGLPLLAALWAFITGLFSQKPK